MTRAQALLSFYDKVGVDARPSARTGAMPETLRDYRRSDRIPSDALRALTPDDCLALCAAFGGALRLDIAVDDVFIPIRGEAPPSRDELESRLHEATEIRDEGSMQIVIDKTALAAAVLAARGVTDDTLNCIYYLFAAHLAALLEREGLRQLDHGLFASAIVQTVIVIADGEDMQYAGDLLTIVAEDSLVANPEALHTPPSDLPTRVAQYRDAVETQLGWDFALDHLTPLHLACECRGGEFREITAALSRHHFTLGVLYTANRVRRSADERRYVAVYSEQDREAHIALDAGTPGADLGAVTKLARWPYAGEGRNLDRLTVLRKVLAQALHEPTAEQNSCAFVANLPALLTETQAQYNLFISGQLDKYLQQRQSAADYVADVAKKVADVVEAIVKGVGEALLATLAAILTVLVAALSNDKVRGDVFTLSLVAYTGYVSIQAIYRLASASDSLALLWGETSIRLEGYKPLVSAEAFRALNDTLTARRKQFERWRFRTVLVYLLMITAVLVLAVGGPHASVFQAVPPTAPAIATTPAPKP